MNSRVVHTDVDVEMPTNPAERNGVVSSVIEQLLLGEVILDPEANPAATCDLSLRRPTTAAATTSTDHDDSTHSTTSIRELYDITECFHRENVQESNTTPSFMAETSSGGTPVTTTSSSTRNLPPMSNPLYDPATARTGVSAAQRRVVRVLTIILLFLNALAGLRALILAYRRRKG